MEIQLDVEHFTPYSKSSQQKKIVGFFIDLIIKKRMTFSPSYDLHGSFWGFGYFRLLLGLQGEQKLILDQGPK